MYPDRACCWFEVGRKEEKRLRFSGKQFDASAHDTLLHVEDNTRTTTYIEITRHRNPGDPVTKGEEKQLRSVVGSRSWIARQARPDIPYRVSKLQSGIKGATAFHFKRGEQSVGARAKWNGPETPLQERAIQLPTARRTDCDRRLVCWRVR